MRVTLALSAAALLAGCATALGDVITRNGAPCAVSIGVYACSATAPRERMTKDTVECRTQARAEAAEQVPPVLDVIPFYGIAAAGKRFNTTVERNEACLVARGYAIQRPN